MICSSAFWKQKCENLKNVSLTFFKFKSICLWPEALIDSFIALGEKFITKLDNYIFVSVDRQTFLGFEMTSNSRDTSPLRGLCSQKSLLFKPVVEIMNTVNTFAHTQNASILQV